MMRMRCIATSHPHYYYILKFLEIFANFQYLCYNILCTPYTVCSREKGHIMTTTNAIQLVLVDVNSDNPNKWVWKFHFLTSPRSSSKFCINFDTSTPSELVVEASEPELMTVGDVCLFRDMCFSVCDAYYIELVFQNGTAPIVEHNVLSQLLQLTPRFIYINCTNLYFNAFAETFYGLRKIEVIA